MKTHQAKNLGKHHPSRGNTGSPAFKIRDKTEWPLDWRSWPEQAAQKQQSETQGLVKKAKETIIICKWYDHLCRKPKSLQAN